MTAMLSFSCPRCATDVEDTYYGPCGSCRADLVATMEREAQDVEAAAYEPKMNVVPNQVATKD
jgi:hypothetical protein